MTIDPYSSCPGGTGKKIKFCCSDLVHELDKLQRMIDGEQRVAGLEYVTKLDAKYPGRACLLSVRATLETMLGNREQSAATLATFREKHPDNPVALAELAVVQAGGESPTDAIESLERAVACCSDEILPAVYDAFGAVAQQLAMLGHYPAAQSLLWFQVAFSRGEDKEALQQWAALEAEPRIPIFLKLPTTLEPTPAGAPWKYEFELALEQAQRGQVHIAAKKFAALIPIAGKSPALWRNLSRLRAWCADYPGAIEAFHRLAESDLPLDDAVEAEATAILLEIAHSRQTSAEGASSAGDQLSVTFAVTNQTSLEERLAANRQFERIVLDPQYWKQIVGDDGGNDPPPKACFSLLDRPLPAADDLSREQIPRVLGTLFVFSRQTDRQERLELTVARGELPTAEELIRRVGGDAVGETSKDVKARSRYQEPALAWQFRFPDHLPREKRAEFDDQELHHRLLNVWPDTPRTDLNGQTPRQAVADPKLRLRVMARLLLLETDLPQTADDALRQLREQLGLPIPAAIDPTTAELTKFPRVRLDRLQTEKLTDGQLLDAFKRATVPRQIRALTNFAREIIRRDSLAGRPEVLSAYGILLSITAETDRSLELVEKARLAAQRAKQSTASFDLAELRLRFERGEQAEVGRLIDHLQREHGKEPGVFEAVFELLYDLGLVDERGRPIGAADAPASPISPASPIIVPGTAAPGKILVPGGEPAAASSKPVIWTPGME